MSVGIREAAFEVNPSPPLSVTAISVREEAVAR